jgi:hypothetical protein
MITVPQVVGPLIERTTLEGYVAAGREARQHISASLLVAKMLVD